VWAIVVAGGAGRRFGEPKQFLELAGRPVVTWSVAAARTVADGVVLVVPGGPETEGGEARPGGGEGAGPGGGGEVVPGHRVPDTGADLVVAGGATRAQSVRAGLAAVPDHAGIIVVHDAARPLATASLFAAVIEAVRAGGADGAVPALPVADTLKKVAGGTVQSTMDRQGLVAVQTPQAFVATTLRSAHRHAGDATDDASLVENLGATVRTVDGEPHNLKLTRPEDLVLAEAVVKTMDRTVR
jgi:2-C-methyl-D-erythritol 4-phosphate cytidylyltransferase